MNGKKIAVLLIVVMMSGMNILAGCSDKDSGSDPKWPAMETLSTLSASDITQIEYSRATEGGYTDDVTGDPTEIEDIFLRLKEVSITDKTEEAVEDDNLGLIVEAGDKKLSFDFEGDILTLEDGSRYKVENLGSLRSYIDDLLKNAVGPKEGMQDTTGQQTGSGSGDYDVETNFSKSEYNGMELLYFNDFLITMPGNEKWSFEMNGNSVTFYLFSAQQEGYGGKLVTIKAYDIDDDSYKNLPVDYHVAGVGNNVNKRFIAIYPSDLQYNPQDSAQTADYKDLYNYLYKIGEGAVNSPLQTADSSPAP